MNVHTVSASLQSLSLSVCCLLAASFAGRQGEREGGGRAERDWLVSIGTRLRDS